MNTVLAQFIPKKFERNEVYTLDDVKKKLDCQVFYDVDTRCFQEEQLVNAAAIKAIHYFVTQGTSDQKKELRAYRSRIKKLNYNLKRIKDENHPCYRMHVELPKNRLDKFINAILLIPRITFIFITEIGFGWPVYFIMLGIRQFSGYPDPNKNVCKKHHEGRPAIILSHGYSGNHLTFAITKLFLKFIHRGAVYSVNFHEPKCELNPLTLKKKIDYLLSSVKLSILQTIPAKWLSVSCLQDINKLKEAKEREQQQIESEADDFKSFELDQGVTELTKVTDQAKQETKCKEVILVGHSMGGLISSLFAKKCDADQDNDTIIKHIFTIATPWRGSDLASRCFPHTRLGFLHTRWESFKNFLNKHIESYIAIQQMATPNVFFGPDSDQHPTCTSRIQEIVEAALETEHQGKRKHYNTYSKLDHVIAHPSALITDHPDRQCYTRNFGHSWILTSWTINRFLMRHLKDIYKPIICPSS